MKKQWWMAMVAVGVAGILGLCGCEGGGGDDDDDAPPPGDAAVHANVAGVWHGTRSSAGGSSSATLTLTQSGGSIGGNYQDTSLFSGPVSGSINGDDLDLVVTMASVPPPWTAGEVWTIKGAVNAAETKIISTMKASDGESFSLKVAK